jgi:hypothetical protein
MAILNAGTVNALFNLCLVEHEAIPEIENQTWFVRYSTKRVRGHGYILFHPLRLNEVKPAVADLLMQLPTEFFYTIGAGSTFLNLVTNANNEVWTTLHDDCDKLVCLGVALGLVRVMSDENNEVLKQALPGGMPYIAVLDDVIRDYHKFSLYLATYTRYKWHFKFD